LREAIKRFFGIGMPITVRETYRARGDRGVDNAPELRCRDSTCEFWDFDIPREKGPMLQFLA
jgi:hypothetical protein